jgi:hypothetical protein
MAMSTQMWYGAAHVSLQKVWRGFYGKAKQTIGKSTKLIFQNGRVIGLSKMNRIVDIARPRVQERLTMQIVQELQIALGTEDVACVIDAKHLCVNSRGIDIESSTVTSEFGGKFKDNVTRREFGLYQIRNKVLVLPDPPKERSLVKSKQDYKQLLLTHSRLNPFPLGRAGWKTITTMPLYSNQTLKIYNSLSGEKKTFVPIQ